MPRENKEPVLCQDCRFNIDDYCKRNPPTPVVEIYKNMLPLHKRLWIFISGQKPRFKYNISQLWAPIKTNNNQDDRVLGCFAGEKKDD